jgi:hypothetical protein
MLTKPKVTTPDQIERGMTSSGELFVQEARQSGGQVGARANIATMAANHAL